MNIAMNSSETDASKRTRRNARASGVPEAPGHSGSSARRQSPDDAVVEDCTSTQRLPLGDLRAAADHISLGKRYGYLEKEYEALIRFQVATRRLLAARSRKGFFVAVEEIVANLIGSEEMGVFRLAPDRSSLALLTSVGIEPARFARLGLEAEPIARAVKDRRVWINDAPGSRTGEIDPRRPTACIPLTVDGEVIGAIVIFRLLPQKRSLEAVDRELFELLQAQAAVALHRANLEAQYRAGEWS